MKNALETFRLPRYTAPDFSENRFADAPDVLFVPCVQDGVLPEGYHSTSMYPEYFKIGGTWHLAEESRMDSHVVLRPDGRLEVVEMRNIKAGDRCAVGRKEDGTEGIFVHADGFSDASQAIDDKFLFRTNRSRETAFGKEYDLLVRLLCHEKEHGHILWVLGPAFAFDAAAREAMQWLIMHGFAHGLMAGNALATHDLEAATMHTALGQDIYTGINRPLGHYHHIDLINRVRTAGSIRDFVYTKDISDGIMASVVRREIPFVLAGSIRDDGPLPDVCTDSGISADRMRDMIRPATTVICMATMLHTIATGNMTPSFRVMPDGTVRPLYFYCVDADEFVTNKLHDRGSLSAHTVIANVQDFIVRLVMKLKETE